MSQVRNSLRDLASRSDDRRAEALEMFGEAMLIEDALRHWARASASDPFLPYLIFNLAKLYSDLGTEDARTHKDAVLDWLSTSFLMSACTKRGPV